MIRPWWSLYEMVVNVIFGIVMWQLWTASVHCTAAKTRFLLVVFFKFIFPQKKGRDEMRNKTFLCFHKWIALGCAESGMSCRMVNKRGAADRPTDREKVQCKRDFFTFPVFKFDLTLNVYKVCALVRSFWKLIMQKSVQHTVGGNCNLAHKWNDNRHFAAMLTITIR